MQVLLVIGRTFLMYGLVLVVMRTMGKRELGQISPFDLVVAVMIAELAAIPLERVDAPLLPGMIAILTLAGLEILLARTSLAGIAARRIISGRPSLIIARGKLVEEEMRRLNYNLDDLLAQLRRKGHFGPAEVEWAVLECSGDLSIIPVGNQRPVVTGDLGVTTGDERLPRALILDGELDREALAATGLTEKQLLAEVKRKGAKDMRGVLFAGTDRQGELYVQPKAHRRR
ncbi:MAG TPA: DUF421 domain-containing protein [Bacillota bacterium]|nr:DUF421 domain-containing protein [Bacillota bacterium]